MPGRLLFLAAVFIWGSTWIPIGIQAPLVAPEVSVAYRFLIAGVILIGSTWLGGGRLRFPLRDHLFLACQGLFLFCLNYIPLYWASRSLASGLVALAFSTGVVFAILLGAARERRWPEGRIVAGAGVGLAGLALIFAPDAWAAGFSGGMALPVMLCFVAAFFGAAGTLVGARNARAGISVVASSGFGMLYGGIATAAYVSLAGAWAWDASWAYALSLSYLVLVGSIAGFWCYLSVVAALGPERAAFIPVLFPLVALGLSTALEGYAWSLEGLIGVALVCLGNGWALRKGKPKADPALPAADAARLRP